MEILIVIIVALAGAMLSFMSGFGLGTILLPVFLLFFPPEAAVLATALVHMANNVFKLVLVGKYANWRMVIRFGITSVIGAWCGAELMSYLPMDVWYSYGLLGHTMEVKSSKVIFGSLILFFAFYELRDEQKKSKLATHWLPWGGLISGFFGGLSGHQGALRSAFLLRTDLDKNAFMGTRVVLACMVDVTRISVYVGVVQFASASLRWDLLLAASLAAFCGAFFGKKWMQASESNFVNRFIAVAMLIFGLALIAGLV